MVPRFRVCNRHHQPMLFLPVSSLLLLSSVLTTAAVAVASYRPVVVWHGLGDSHNSEGMLSVKEDIEDLYPGIRVHLIYIDEDGSKDRNAGFVSLLHSLTTSPEEADGRRGAVARCVVLTDIHLLVRERQFSSGTRRSAAERHPRA